MMTDLGPRLREARTTRGLSLRTVASAIGVSPSLISQVENGKTHPSVSTLYALVSYLDISVDDLIQPDTLATPSSPAANDAPPLVQGVVVQRGVDNPVLEMENGVVWERLASDAGGPIDPLLVTYAPGASSSIEGKMMRHSGYEYALILEGELVLRLEFDTFHLGPGDSMQFDSSRPHMYENRGTTPARGVWYVVGRRDRSAAADAPAPATLSSAVDVLRALDTL